MAFNQGQSTGSVPVQTSAPVTYSQPITGGRGPFQVETYKGRQSIVVGAVLILVGILAVIFNIVDVAISTDLYENYDYHYVTSSCYSGGCIAHGFWGGALTIIAGALGVATGNNRTRCLITALLILAIITMVATGIQTIIAAASASGLYIHADNKRCVNDNSYYSRSDTKPCQQLITLVAMEALMAAMGGIAFFLCLWASVLCCTGNGCCSGPTPGVTYAVVTTGGTQMTVVTQQQYGQQYGQPPMQQQQQQQQQQYPLVYNPATGCYSYAPAPAQQYMAGPPSYNNVATAPPVIQPGYVAPPPEEAKY